AAAGAVHHTARLRLQNGWAACEDAVNPDRVKRSALLLSSCIIPTI
ncbi:hypothetical protein CpipJ_CPIJ018669, partial [Culex quinquefasciatus]